ncbi:MAG: hypothetical protein E7047_10175 [Lentisphaerae bacterium]|nr:hypothetical protein [Lentisphaerota bacterium]
MQQLIDRCLKVFENEYLADTTNLVYDYRNTLDHDRRFYALPTPEEIAKRLPNPCSWGSGMENGMINTPIALSMYIDAGNAEMAYRMYQGLKLCGTITGVPGALVRSVHPGDGKSWFPEASRDQYTHYVYSLWEYYHSGMASEDTQAEIRELLSAVADHCEKYITKETNYTLPRADFDPVQSPVCQLWEVEPHEAARLPMFYAAAYDVTGNGHYFEMYRKYAVEAGNAGNNLECMNYNSFALLQMLLSCLLIYQVEKDRAIRELYLENMREIQRYSYFDLLRASNWKRTNDIYLAPMDWHMNSYCRVYPGCRHVIPKLADDIQIAYQVMREINEVMLIALMMPEAIRDVSGAHRRNYRFVMEGFEPEKYYFAEGTFFPVAVWNKARKLNIEL